jgi:hypothetical protein
MIEVKLVFKAPQSKCKQRKFSNLRRNSKIPPKKRTPNPENTVFLKQFSHYPRSGGSPRSFRWNHKEVVSHHGH